MFLLRSCINQSTHYLHLYRSLYSNMLPTLLHSRSRISAFLYCYRALYSIRVVSRLSGIAHVTSHFVVIRGHCPAPRHPSLPARRGRAPAYASTIPQRMAWPLPTGEHPIQNLALFSTNGTFRWFEAFWRWRSTAPYGPHCVHP